MPISVNGIPKITRAADGEREPSGRSTRARTPHKLSASEDEWKYVANAHRIAASDACHARRGCSRDGPRRNPVSGRADAHIWSSTDKIRARNIGRLNPASEQNR